MAKEGKRSEELTAKEVANIFADKAERERERYKHKHTQPVIKFRFEKKKKELGYASKKEAMELKYTFTKGLFIPSDKYGYRTRSSCYSAGLVREVSVGKEIGLNRTEFMLWKLQHRRQQWRV